MRRVEQWAGPTQRIMAGLLGGAVLASTAAYCLRPDRGEVLYAMGHAPGVFRAAAPERDTVVASPVPVAAAPLNREEPSWRHRLALVDQTEGRAAARAMLMAAIRHPGQAPAATLVEASYAFGVPEALVTAAETGAIPPLDPARALDLARRAEHRDPALIARIDRVAAGDWRRGDPWLALRLAQARGDAAMAARAIADLPPDARAAAEENVAVALGGEAGLRALLLRRAAADPGESAALADRLDSLGARADAIGLLQRVADTAPVHAPASARLLALWGPRPPASALAWLLDRANRAQSAEDHLGWLTAYADRTRPDLAGRMIARDVAADSSAVLRLRLRLAAETDDRVAGAVVLHRLLDGRKLAPTELVAITRALPPGTDPTLRLMLARRRVEAGVALPQDRLDLGFDALRRTDIATARHWLAAHLATAPADTDAMVALADIAARVRDPRTERHWIGRAIAGSTGDSAVRAGLLARVGRLEEALAMVGRLRKTQTGDRMLIATQARLLVAAGRPGAAQALFQ